MRSLERHDIYTDQAINATGISICIYKEILEDASCVYDLEIQQFEKNVLTGTAKIACNTFDSADQLADLLINKTVDIQINSGE